MNQSLALLYKDPSLAEELHDDIRKANYRLEAAHTFSLIGIWTHFVDLSSVS